jgi:hypothetical protein
MQRLTEKNAAKSDMGLTPAGVNLRNGDNSEIVGTVSFSRLPTTTP